MRLLQNDAFRFGITLCLALQYSLLRSTELSTIVKPLPILFWLLIVLVSSKRLGGDWVAVSLVCAAIGDVMLDLRPDWLIIATVPFLASTLILAGAFYRRGRATKITSAIVKEIALLAPLAILAFGFHQFMALHMAETALIGAVLMFISTVLIWRALIVLILRFEDADTALYRWAGFAGACGIVANYVLYSINIGLHPIPRDLVIQLYYAGQAFVAWSFLQPRKRNLEA